MSRIFLCITSNPSESFSIFIFQFLAPKNRTSAVDFVYLPVMNLPAPDPHEELVRNPRQRRELTDSQQDRIISCLLWELQSHGQNGRFARRTVTVVANEFYVCSKTIRRVWARALENFQIRRFDNFAPTPKNNVVDAIGSGTMRKYAKQFVCFLFFRGKNQRPCCSIGNTQINCPSDEDGQWWSGNYAL